jgi:WD40 repeat protein
LFDPKDARETKELTRSRALIGGLSFNPEGTLLAASASDRTLRIWDVAGASVRRELSVRSGGLSFTEFSPDIDNIAVLVKCGIRILKIRKFVVHIPADRDPAAARRRLYNKPPFFKRPAIPANIIHIGHPFPNLLFHFFP